MRKDKEIDIKILESELEAISNLYDLLQDEVATDLEIGRFVQQLYHMYQNNIYGDIYYPVNRTESEKIYITIIEE